MLLRMKTGMMLLMLLTIFVSCQSPAYKVIERCDSIEELDICRCSKYDFNIPKKIGDPYSMPMSYCTSGKKTIFHMDEWGIEIVPVREAKRYLENSKSKRDYKKRLRKIKKKKLY